MTFTNPSFLWLLPLSSVPIVVHLLGRRLRKEIPFSWVNLLVSSAKTGKFRRKLTEILILTLRVLVIALPIIAISGPRTKGKLPIDMIAVDVSHSMKPHQKEIQKLLQSLKKEYPNAKIVYFADRLVPEFDFTHLPTDFSILGEFKDNILVITDLQKTGFRTPFNTVGKWYISLVEPINNVALTSAQLKTPFYLEGHPILIKLTVANYSDKPQSRVLVIKGAREVRQNIKIGGKSSINIEKLVTPDQFGKVTFDLLPHDKMPEDDRRTLFAIPIKSLKVAVVGNPKHVILSLLKPKGTKTPFTVDTFNTTPSISRLNTANLIIFINTLPPSFKNFSRYYAAKGIPIIVFDGVGSFLQSITGYKLNPQTLQINGQSLKGFDLTHVKGTSVLISDEGLPIAKRTKWGLLAGFSPEVSNEFVITDRFVFFIYLNILKLFGMGTLNPYYLTGSLIKLTETDLSARVVTEEGGYVPITITKEKYVEFTPLKQGVYYVVSGADTLYRFSAWIPPRESDLTVTPSEEISALLKDAKLVTAEELFGDSHVNLVWLLFGLAVLTLFIEGMLLRFRGM